MNAVTTNSLETKNGLRFARENRVPADPPASIRYVGGIASITRFVFWLIQLGCRQIFCVSWINIAFIYTCGTFRLAEFDFLDLRFGSAAEWVSRRQRRINDDGL